MKNLKKVFFGCFFGLVIALFALPEKADAACTKPGYYDVTYPSRYCDPQGIGSCLDRECPPVTQQ